MPLLRAGCRHKKFHLQLCLWFRSQILKIIQSPCERGSEEHFVRRKGRRRARSEQLRVADGFLLLLYLIMDLLWMVLPVFLVCSAAQNLTEIKVQLGQDITLNCLIDNPSIHWYMEIHSQFRGCIVRVINDNPNQYFVSTSISKYEAINGKRLVIKNITAEDCRLYFCARRIKDEISFEYAFHVVSGEYQVSYSYSQILP